jgi:hypothetical protein
MSKEDVVYFGASDSLEIMKSFYLSVCLILSTVKLELKAKAYNS